MPQRSWFGCHSLGGIAVPGNEVGFLGVALAVLSEDGEGLGNRACNVLHFRTSVIQVLKKLKSRDSNRALFRNFFITLKKVVLIECFDSCYTKTSFNIRNRKLLLIISTITITAGSKRKQNGCLPLNSGKHP